MTTNTFAYNGFGARVSKSDSGGSTTYLRSGTSVVAPVVSVPGAESATFTPGISERRGTESRFYHGDIKNFVEQTDSSGQIVSSQQYDAFGNPVSSSGTWSGPFAYGGRFGYQSDSDTSLSLLGHRYYEPTTGRFLSRDPIGDGRNWYVYCDNNPAALADPTGLKIRLVGYDPENERKVREQLDELKRNPATKQMMYELVNDPLDHVISPKNSPNVPWARNEPAYYPPGWRVPEEWRDTYGDPAMPSGGRIRYDPNETLRLPHRGARIEIPPGTGLAPEAFLPDHDRIDIDMPPLVVLGHELGHAYRYPDNWKTAGHPGDNVRRVENPLRKTLGLPFREVY